MPTRALTTFLLCFAVVAPSGLAVVEVGHAAGDYEGGWIFVPGIGTRIAEWIVFLIETLVLGIVSAGRGRVREWLAGYAGVVLGGTPVVARDVAYAGLGAGMVLPSVFVAASVAGVIFLVIGGLRLGNARAAHRGLPRPPPVPPEAYGGGEHG